MGLTNADPSQIKPGDDLGTITTIGGNVYKSAKLVKIEPDGISILDSDGGAKIPFDKLSPDLQQKFGYDPQQAQSYAQTQQYQQRIAQLEEENGKLRTALVRYQSALSQAQEVSAKHSDVESAKNGYIYFYNYLAHDWHVSMGRFTDGPCAKMTPVDAQNYVQQQWEALSNDERLAYEQRAQMYGPGPAPGSRQADETYDVNVTQH